jgi:hypothetical protein
MTRVPLAGLARGIACLLGAGAVSTFQLGCGVDVRPRLMSELAAAGLPTGPDRPAGIVSEEEVRSFPEPVQRYLAFMGAVGAPRVWSFRAGFEGRFRRGPDEAWREVDAIWHLPQGDFVYAELRTIAANVAFDVPPGK